MNMGAGIWVLRNNHFQATVQSVGLDIRSSFFTQFIFENSILNTFIQASSSLRMRTMGGCDGDGGRSRRKTKPPEPVEPLGRADASELAVVADVFVHHAVKQDVAAAGLVLEGFVAANRADKASAQAVFRT